MEPDDERRAACGVLALVFFGLTSFILAWPWSCGCSARVWPSLAAAGVCITLAALVGREAFRRRNTKPLPEPSRLLRKWITRAPARVRRLGILALLAVGAIMSALTFSQALADFRAHKGPAHAVSSDVEFLQVDSYGEPGDFMPWGYTVDLTLYGATYPYHWRCNRRTCNEYAKLIALYQNPPQRAAIQTVEGQLIGLIGDGKTYLEPSIERERLISRDGVRMLWSIAWLFGFGAGAVLVVRKSLAASRRRYRAPGALEAATVRGKVRDALHSEPR